MDLHYDSKRYDAFTANFRRLQANREKVPLEQLQTGRYAAAYAALVEKLKQDADWWAGCYRAALAFPRHPKDKAGNEWLDKRLQAILQDERKPGGRVERYQAALIDHLSMDEYEQLVWEIYDRQEREAFEAYWQRHNRWIGPSDNRWIYSDIFRKFWWPPERNGLKSGCWITKDYTGHDFRYPPNPDKMRKDEQHEQTAPN